MSSFSQGRAISCRWWAGSSTCAVTAGWGHRTMELQTKVREFLNFTITEKRRPVLGRAFALLKSPTIAFTLKNLLKDTTLNMN